MSWTTDLYIGELRPWPSAVLVVRGNTDETMLYTMTPMPHFWTADGVLHVEPKKLPERIDVTLPDERGREVRSARVRRYVAERTCCAIISDNLNESEGMGDAWANCSECGELLYVLTDINSKPPRFCPSCGAKVMDE